MSTAFATPKLGYSPHSMSHAVDTLPADILSRIFTYLSSAKHFSVSCHTFLAISQDAIAVSSHLFQRYGPLLAIELSMKRHPKAVTPKVLDVLLKKGALISRSHIQRFAAQPNAIRGLSAAIIGALYSRAAKKFGNVDLGESDTMTVLTLIEKLENPHTSNSVDAEDIRKMLFKLISTFNWYPTPDDLVKYNAIYGSSTTESTYPNMINLIFNQSSIADLLAKRGFCINEIITPSLFINPINMTQMQPLKFILMLNVVYIDKCIFQKLLRNVDPAYRQWWVYFLRVVKNIRLSFNPLPIICEYIASIDTACPALLHNHLRCISIVSDAWSDHSLILDATLQLAAGIPLNEDGQPTQSMIDFMKRALPAEDKDFTNWLLGRKRGGGPGISHPFVAFMMDLDITLAATGVISVPEFFNNAACNGARIRKRHIELMMHKPGNVANSADCVCKFLSVIGLHNVHDYEFINSHENAHDNEVRNGIAVLKDVAERRRRVLGDKWGEFQYENGAVFDWCLKRWFRQKSLVL